MRHKLMSIALLLNPVHANAAEIHPTEAMLREAARIANPVNGDKWKYHFRNVEGHILFCSYLVGRNGGFCTRDGQSVKQIDQAVIQFCRETPNAKPPHEVYVEAWDLDYRCVGSDMRRLPYSYAFDEEGYMRSEWKVLP